MNGFRLHLALALVLLVAALAITNIQAYAGAVQPIDSLQPSNSRGPINSLTFPSGVLANGGELVIGRILVRAQSPSDPFVVSRVVIDNYIKRIGIGGLQCFDSQGAEDGCYISIVINAKQKKQECSLGFYVSSTLIPIACPTFIALKSADEIREGIERKERDKQRDEQRVVDQVHCFSQCSDEWHSCMSDAKNECRNCDEDRRSELVSKGQTECKRENRDCERTCYSRYGN